MLIAGAVVLALVVTLGLSYWLAPERPAAVAGPLGQPSAGGPTAAGGSSPAHHNPSPPGCSQTQAAFCDTFDAPFGGPFGDGKRTGALDPSKWTVAHIVGSNIGQGDHAFWHATPAAFCRDRVDGLLPPKDYFYCDNHGRESMHFMEALEDGGGYVYNDLMMLQPFDFAGRTGTLTFDVDAKTAGSHGWWIDVWITDEPVPGPHAGHNDNDIAARNGFGLRFDVGCKTNRGKPGTRLSLIHLLRDYRYEAAQMKPSGPAEGCFATYDDSLNRITVKLTTTGVEVWATDHDDATRTNSRKVASFDRLNLPFSRGYVHFEHVQYNATKAGATSYQTYHWDNIGFDGPKVPPLRSYAVPDALVRKGRGMNLGYRVGGKGTAFTLDGVDLAGAKRAYLALTSWCENSGGCPQLTYTVNGTSRTYAKPEHTIGDLQLQSLVVPVDLADLQAGRNVIGFGAGVTVVSNVNLYVETG